MHVWQYVVFSVALLFVASFFTGTDAQFEEKSFGRGYGYLEDDVDPVAELALQVLRSRQLSQYRQRNPPVPEPPYKRGGLDLGIGRGFSASQAAKHLMGLASANLAEGPGRRRRDAPTA